MDQLQNEKCLMSKISNGDVKSFEKLFDAYFQYLHNMAYNRLQSKEAADDLVQDVFTDIWKNRKDLEIHTSLKSYLYQAVKYKVYKFFRHQAVRDKEEYIRRIHDRFYALNSFPDIESTVKQNEIKNIVAWQLDQFPEQTRNIFNMSRQEQFTHGEIAEKLNCSPKTVEYHIGKVLTHLRLSLKDYIAILILLCLPLLM